MVAAEIGEPFANPGIMHCLDHVRVYFAHDAVGSSDRSQQGLPANRLEAGKCFGHDRQIGCAWEALRSSDGKRCHLPASIAPARPE